MTFFRRLHLAIRAFWLCLRHDQIPALVTIAPEDKKRFLAGAPGIIGPDQKLIVASDEPLVFGDRWTQAYVAFLTARARREAKPATDAVAKLPVFDWTPFIDPDLYAQSPRTGQPKSAAPPDWIDTTRHGEP